MKSKNKKQTKGRRPQWLHYFLLQVGWYLPQWGKGIYPFCVLYSLRLCCNLLSSFCHLIELVSYLNFLVISVMNDQFQGTDASRVDEAINLATTFASMKLRWYNMQSLLPIEETWPHCELYRNSKTWELNEILDWAIIKFDIFLFFLTGIKFDLV